ncbi:MULTISPECIES: acyl carrier protein [Streptomyces]|uniref:Acyl carrier protein n=1 Tax=Streptomyces xanthii TaxID=2768069 RepID=A0A7H1BKM4_9ACTN|nr:phosphopantetheine-binding protein [Streptomyces xanthii]QNS09279.1 acyl carrier protein [Streptomyces xanthii]
MTQAPIDVRAHTAELVKEVVTEILPGVDRDLIGGSRHLKDLGADSVDRVEIIAALLDRTGVDAPMSAFSDLPDIDSLVDFLSGAPR